MVRFHLRRNRGGPSSYYQVEVSYNLFGEYSVQREWGRDGKPGLGGSCRIAWFANLRDACLAAERWQNRAVRRGYTGAGA